MLRGAPTAALLLFFAHAIFYSHFVRARKDLGVLALPFRARTRKFLKIFFSLNSLKTFFRYVNFYLLY